MSSASEEKQTTGAQWFACISLLLLIAIIFAGFKALSNTPIKKQLGRSQPALIQRTPADAGKVER